MDEETRETVARIWSEADTESKEGYERYVRRAIRALADHEGVYASDSLEDITEPAESDLGVMYVKKALKRLIERGDIQRLGRGEDGKPRLRLA